MSTKEFKNNMYMKQLRSSINTIDSRGQMSVGAINNKVYKSKHFSSFVGANKSIKRSSEGRLNKSTHDDSIEAQYGAGYSPILLKSNNKVSTPCFTRIKKKCNETPKKSFVGKINPKTKYLHASDHKTLNYGFSDYKSKNSIQGPSSSCYGMDDLKQISEENQHIKSSYPVRPTKLDVQACKSRNIESMVGKSSSYYQTKIKSPFKTQSASKTVSARSSNISASDQKSRNSAINSKYRTMDTDEFFIKSKDIEDSCKIESSATAEMSEVQPEAKVQLPTRFRSREKMMAFKRQSQTNYFEGKLQRNCSKSQLFLDRYKDELKENIPDTLMSGFAEAEKSGDHSSICENNPGPIKSEDSFKAENKINADTVLNRLRNKFVKDRIDTKSRDLAIKQSLTCSNMDLKTPLHTYKEKLSPIDVKPHMGSCIETLNLSRISSNRQSETENLEKSESNDEVNALLKGILKTNIQNTEELKKQVAALENRLNDANIKIDNLQKALEDEKVKSSKKGNVTTSSSEIKDKGNSNSFLQVFSARNFSVDKPNPNSISGLKTIREGGSTHSRNNITELKRAKSIEVYFKSGVNHLKSDYEEDLEFQKYELNAIYQTKVDTILHHKTKEDLTKDVLSTLKTVGSPKSSQILDKNNIEEVFENTLLENASLKEENEKLKSELARYKQESSSAKS